MKIITLLTSVAFALIAPFAFAADTKIDNKINVNNTAETQLHKQLNLAQRGRGGGGGMRGGGRGGMGMRGGGRRGGGWRGGRYGGRYYHRRGYNYWVPAAVIGTAVLLNSTNRRYANCEAVHRGYAYAGVVTRKGYCRIRVGNRIYYKKYYSTY